MKNAWVIVCMPGEVLFASRDTREECERLLEDPLVLTCARKFGQPVISQRVVSLRSPQPSR